MQRDIDNARTSINYTYENGEKTSSEEIKGVHFVRESQTPTIYNNTKEALNDGKPNILHYDPADRSQRSKQALKGYPSRGGERLQRDEYPYASTKEGGDGAIVNYVPSIENSTQGGLLRGLYLTLNVNDAFLVLPVPRSRDFQPEFNPAFVPQSSSKSRISPVAAGAGLGGAIITIFEGILELLAL